MPVITFMGRISNWNFVRVPKAWLWAHEQSFSLKCSWEVRFLQYTKFERIFWRALETLVKQPPDGEMITHADLHWRGINNYNYGAWPVQKTIRPQIIMMANSNSIYFCIQFAFNNRRYVIYVSKTWLYFNNAFELNCMLMSTGRIEIYIKPHNSCHHIITGEWHHADHQYMGSLCTTSDMWKVS